MTPTAGFNTRGPTPARHCLRPFSSFRGKSVAEIAPPEPVTLFNDMSEQNVTALLGGKETTEWEKKP